MTQTGETQATRVPTLLEIAFQDFSKWICHTKATLERMEEWIGCVQKRVEDLEKQALWAQTELPDQLLKRHDELASRVAQLEKKIN